MPSAGGKVLRVLMSTYEPEQTAMFEQCLKAGDVFLDVGAHVGYYTLISSRAVGVRGRVVAFEPEPKNLVYLKEHVHLNQCSNVTVVATAVGRERGMASFEYGTGTGTGRVVPGLNGSGSFQVPVISLDEFCEKNNLIPQGIKMDIEGGEIAALAGAKRVLERSRPIIFLSTHGPKIHQECMSFLKSSGYAFKAINGGGVDQATELFCFKW